jgi:hypothetical protein
MKKTVFFLLMSMQMLFTESEATLPKISALITSSLEDANPILSPNQCLRKHCRHHHKHRSSSSHCCIPGPQGPQGIQGPQGPAATTAGLYIYSEATNSVTANTSLFTTATVNPLSFGGLVFDPNTGFVTVPFHGYYQISYGVSTILNDGAGNQMSLVLNSLNNYLVETQSATNASQLASLSIIIELQEGDHITAVLTNNGGTLHGNAGTPAISSPITAFLSMHLLQQLP